jgi:GT2 family glycosyltransferase
MAQDRTKQPPVPPHSVSVVIPNWNGAVHLPECLDSIDAQTLKPLEVIVVDNGSTDDSLQLLARMFSKVIVVRLSSNRGFAAAVNEGIRISRGEFVFLLNNDTRLDEDCIRLMVDRLVASSEWSTVACKMVNYFDNSLIDGAGDMLTRSGLMATRGHGEPDDGRFGKSDEVFGACAGAALYRRSMFEEIGGFDEDFISYLEDADMAFRARLGGYRCVYEPAAICFHKRGATAARMIAAYPARMFERNIPQYVVKNMPLRMLFSRAPLLAASRLRHWYKSALAGQLRPVITGFAEGLALLPGALKKRREVQKLRRIPASTLLDWAGRKSMS